MYLNRCICLGMFPFPLTRWDLVCVILKFSFCLPYVLDRVPYQSTQCHHLPVQSNKYTLLAVFSWLSLPLCSFSNRKILCSHVYGPLGLRVRLGQWQRFIKVKLSGLRCMNFKTDRPSNIPSLKGTVGLLFIRVSFYWGIKFF